MVKGVTRRVVVVRPPVEGAAFEQAIFFVREQAHTSTDVLREACAVAEQYLSTAPRRTRRHWFTRAQLLLAFGGGALSASMLWLLASIFMG